MRNLTPLLFLFFLFACGGGGGGSSTNSNPPEVSTEDTTPESPQVNPLKFVELTTNNNETVRTSIASTSKEQTQGLQFVMPSEFDEDEGKLFFYLSDQSRTFWMPNTYFNLDLIYLDKNLKIIDIVWNLSHYTGNVNSQIPRAPTVKSRHVLEMKAGSRISSGLEVGETLGWKSSLSLAETEARIRNQ